MDSSLALQILSKHLTLEVDFLQAILKVHYTLSRRETDENKVRKALVYTQITKLFPYHVQSWGRG